MHCNARNRGHGGLEQTIPGAWAGEGYCKRKAGWGTDHLGEGRCKYHGGASPIRHGRYSGVKRERLGALIKDLEQEEDPLDTTPEIAAARAVLRTYLEDQARLQTAILAWYYENEEKPRRVPTLADAVGLAEAVTRMVKRVHDAEAQNAISLKELSRLMTEMGRVVAYHVDDQETLDRIRKEWRAIRL